VSKKTGDHYDKLLRSLDQTHSPKANAEEPRSWHYHEDSPETSESPSNPELLFVHKIQSHYAAATERHSLEPALPSVPKFDEFAPKHKSAPDLHPHSITLGFGPLSPAFLRTQDLHSLFQSKESGR